MKKAVFIFMCFISISLFAQNKLESIMVEPPKFSAESANTEIKGQSIHAFIEREIELPAKLNVYEDEGIVGIQFTVEPDGTLSNYTVINNVSKTCNDAVIQCLKRTNGLWSPGKVNGKDASMEKVIFVKFDLIGNASHREIALRQLKNGFRSYLGGMEIKNNPLLTDKRKQVKTERKMKRSISMFNQCMKYEPGDPSALFWQAKAYEEMGNNVQSKVKLDSYLEMVNAGAIEQQIIADETLAYITIKK